MSLMSLKVRLLDTQQAFRGHLLCSYLQKFLQSSRTRTANMGGAIDHGRHLLLQERGECAAEASVLAGLHSPHIIQFMDSFIDEVGHEKPSKPSRKLSFCRCIWFCLMLNCSPPGYPVHCDGICKRRHPPLNDQSGPWTFARGCDLATLCSGEQGCCRHAYSAQHHTRAEIGLLCMEAVFKLISELTFSCSMNK